MRCAVYDILAKEELRFECGDFVTALKTASDFLWAHAMAFADAGWFYKGVGLDVAFFEQHATYSPLLNLARHQQGVLYQLKKHEAAKAYANMQREQANVPAMPSYLFKLHDKPFSVSRRRAGRKQLRVVTSEDVSEVSKVVTVLPCASVRLNDALVRRLACLNAHVVSEREVQLDFMPSA